MERIRFNAKKHRQHRRKNRAITTAINLQAEGSTLYHPNRVQLTVEKVISLGETK